MRKGVVCISARVTPPSIRTPATAKSTPTVATPAALYSLELGNVSRTAARSLESSSGRYSNARGEYRRIVPHEAVYQLTSSTIAWD